MAPFDYALDRQAQDDSLLEWVELIKQEKASDEYRGLFYRKYVKYILVHAVHAAHAPWGHRRHSFFIFGLLGHHSFGGQKESGN